MHAIESSRNKGYTPLGERRGKSDLVRFSLDPSWTSVASDSARGRAYPSPPMSGSPPLPPPRNPSVDDRGQAAFGGPGQNVSQGYPTPQLEPRGEHGAGPSLIHYQQQPHASANYPPYQQFGNDTANQYTYQQQQQQRPGQQASQLQPSPMSGYPTAHQQQLETFTANERMTAVEGPGFSSPKTQRKTKGHVASACVPCKRAHLRCDAQRPCDRCMNTGKEDSCVDVQHKKRGRPRLRDERESRYEGMGPAYPPPPEHTMRRPMSVYSATESTPHEQATLHRTGSYRVLKSQSGPPPAHRIEYAASGDMSNFVGPSQAPLRPVLDDEPLCAYLNMGMQISRASKSLCDFLGLRSVKDRKLFDIVDIGDRDKVYRLQRNLEDERQQKEPNYLPPIYGKAEEERVIQSIGMSPYDLAQFTIDHSEVFSFQRPDGQPRASQVRLGLAKRDSTYFVVLVLVPSPHNPYHASTPYPRELAHTFQGHPQMINQAQAIPPHAPYSAQYTEPRPYEQSMPYRQSSSVGTNVGTLSATSGPSYTQSFQRSPYPATQNTNETAVSQLPQRPHQRQIELQLPPIRTQAGSLPAAMQRPEERSGRLDIEVLLEKPRSDYDTRRPR